MKIALVTAYFYPISSGGTEKYVLNLAKSLIKQNHEVHVITTGKKNRVDFYRNIVVYYVNEELSNHPDILSCKSASDNLDDFKKTLKENVYDLIHFHTLTPTFNIFHISAAKENGTIIYFTAHVPGITCVHGDLMLFGKHACDGLIQKHRCTSCYISKKGLSIPISNLIAKSVNVLKYPNSLTNVVERKVELLFELNKLCDKIFLFTNWQKATFIQNGFDSNKLFITNQLLDKEIEPKIPAKNTVTNIGFVGRICHEKGLHILIKAFKSTKRKDLQLHIAGIINDEAYFNKLKAITKTDLNIHWQFNLSEFQIESFYKMIDVLIIPSITYETGPFVLYEAFERNIPVVANKLGDMEIWKKKGFDLKLYNNFSMFKQIINEF